MTFDLKSARVALSRATERPNVATDIYHLAALTYLPAALDEIERQAKRIAELQHFSDDPMGHCNALRSRAQKAEARIAELEAGIRERDDTTGMLLALNATYRTALKKLGQAKRERGKALVEERSQWNAICRDVGADPSDRYCTGEGEDGYPEAREQLRQEEKL